jgi:hypothetical protein
VYFGRRLALDARHITLRQENQALVLTGKFAAFAVIRFWFKRVGNSPDKDFLKDRFGVAQIAVCSAFVVRWESSASGQ